MKTKKMVQNMNFLKETLTHKQNDEQQSPRLSDQDTFSHKGFPCRKSKIGVMQPQSGVPDNIATSSAIQSMSLKNRKNLVELMKTKTCKKSAWRRMALKTSENQSTNVSKMGHNTMP